MTWHEASLLARAGVWVRRSTWPDPRRKVRYESGWGTAPAVAVHVASGVIAGVVRSPQFGEGDFVATDWIVAEPDPAASEESSGSSTGGGEAAPGMPIEYVTEDGKEIKLREIERCDGMRALVQMSEWYNPA